MLCNISLDDLLNTNSVILNNISNVFFNEFLMRLQSSLLEDDKNLLKFRTILQYLIEIVDIMSHPVIYEMIFFFLFGFPQKNENYNGLVSLLLSKYFINIC